MTSRTLQVAANLLVRLVNDEGYSREDAEKEVAEMFQFNAWEMPELRVAYSARQHFLSLN